MKFITVPDRLESRKYHALIVSQNLHPRLAKMHAKSRVEKATKKGKSIDWSMGEAMAFGSLLLQGFNVRICGQDVGRGTFSHRHAMMVCQDTEKIHIPLNNISPDQIGKIEVT